MQTGAVDDSPVPLRQRNRQRAEGEIRAAALELFLRHGYEQTSVDDIAAASGISRRTFFRYFATKDEVLFGRHRDIAEALRQALAGRDDPVLLDQVRHAITQVQFATAPTERAAAIAGLVDRNPALAARQLQLSADLEEVTAEHLAARGLPALDARLLAGAVFGTLRAVRRAAASAEVDAAALLDRAFDLLAPAFLPLPPPAWAALNRPCAPSHRRGGPR